MKVDYRLEQANKVGEESTNCFAANQKVGDGGS